MAVLTEAVVNGSEVTITRSRPHWIEVFLHFPWAVCIGNAIVALENSAVEILPHQRISGSRRKFIHRLDSTTYSESHQFGVNRSIFEGDIWKWPDVEDRPNGL